MNDELVEKVAKAICCDSKCEATRVCDCNIGIFRDSARAAIAVVVEEAAKICDLTAMYNKPAEYETGNTELMHRTAQEVAEDLSAAIRALRDAK